MPTILMRFSHGTIICHKISAGAPFLVFRTLLLCRIHTTCAAARHTWSFIYVVIPRNPNLSGLIDSEGYNFRAYYLCTVFEEGPR